jgi:tetratricopeptide (TPR) repeat protein
MAINIRDTKGNVIGAGVSGSGNTIAHTIINKIFVIHGKEEIELLNSINDESSSELRINKDGKGDPKNLENAQNTKALGNNVNGIWELIRKAENEKGVQIEKIQAGQMLISRDEILIKNIMIQGMSYFFSGDSYNSNQCFDEIIGMDPNNLLAWYNKGTVLAYSGNPQGAIQCFDKVIEINPNYVLAWNDKGMLLTSLGLVNEAMTCLDRAIEIDPRISLPWYNKGVLLGNLGNPLGAIQCFDKAIEIDRTLAPAWYNKAVMLNSIGRMMEAMQCLNVARTLGLPV